MRRMWLEEVEEEAASTAQALFLCEVPHHIKGSSSHRANDVTKHSIWGVGSLASHPSIPDMSRITMRAIVLLERGSAQSSLNGHESLLLLYYYIEFVAVFSAVYRYMHLSLGQGGGGTEMGIFPFREGGGGRESLRTVKP